MTDEMIDLDSYRLEARAWLQANMEKLPPSEFEPWGAEAVSPEQVAASRILQRKLFDGGYAGISYPVEYGGRGLTGAHERVFKQESRGYIMPNFGGAGGVMFGAIGRSLIAHATREFCDHYIPKLLSGEHIWCQYYSEPDAGSDLAGIRTRAVREGDHWVISGAKIWSTGGDIADMAMCLARTNWDVPKHQGLTWFAMPTDAPGVTVNPIVQINGTAGFCQEFLDSVVVPDSDVIGEVNQGWTVTQTMLVYERGGGESGGATEPRKLAPDMVSVARQVGRLEDPFARQAIAEAHTIDFAMFHLGRRIVARLNSSATPQPAVASYGKLASGNFNPRRTRLGITVSGVSGLAWDDEVAGSDLTALNYLNSRVIAIAAGTNEMQRNGIGERVLGLPREPSFDSDKPFSEVLKDAQNWNYRVG